MYSKGVNIGQQHVYNVSIQKRLKKCAITYEECNLVLLLQYPK